MFVQPKTNIDPNTGVLGEYKKVSFDILRMMYPTVSAKFINRVLNNVITKQYKPVPVRLHNNYLKTEENSDVLALLDYIREQKPIITAYGVVFQRHAESENPLTEVIKMFMDNRGIHKDIMYTYPEGSEMYNRYNLFQTLDKRDCNSIYGILSAASSAIYNIYVAASITGNGRALISSATMFFEGFLCNNVKFASLNEVMVFINNVRSERSNRHFIDSSILDRDVPVEEVFAKIVYTIGDFRNGLLKWYPSESDLDKIWIALNHLDQEDLNRIYYKNNLYAFFRNSKVFGTLTHILEKMEEPFLNPNKVPADIKPELEALYEIVKEYVFYNYQYIDAIERNKAMVKKAALISDTDSSIVTFDPWYRFVLQGIQGKTLKIGDPSGKTVQKMVKEYDFNFATQEYKISDELKEMFEEDMNVRFSILNIMAFFCSGLIGEYMLAFTKKHNSYAEDRPCLIIMKNEFTFGTAMLTDQKKHYASIQQLKEGHMLNGGIGKMDTKGLEMNKAGVNEEVRATLNDILLNEVLLANKIDQTRIIKRLAILEKDIYDSLRSGSRKFYKPSTIKSYSSYDDPLRIQGIKASIIWNELCGDDLPKIDLKDRNNPYIVKVVITPSTADKVREKFPDVYERIMALFENGDLFASGRTKEITSLAIHPDIERAPDWVFEFIDYETIINDNLKLFPKDSLNIRDLGNSRASLTNIISV